MIEPGRLHAALAAADMDGIALRPDVFPLDLDDYAWAVLAAFAASHYQEDDMQDAWNPPHTEPQPTESQAIAAAINATATPEERAAAKVAWDALPEWRKQDIRDEAELDLL